MCLVVAWVTSLFPKPMARTKSPSLAPRWPCLLLLLTCRETLTRLSDGRHIRQCDGREIPAAKCVFPSFSRLPAIRIKTCRSLRKWRRTRAPDIGMILASRVSIIGGSILRLLTLPLIIAPLALVLGPPPCLLVTPPPPLVIGCGLCRTLPMRKNVACDRLTLIKVVRTFGRICMMAFKQTPLIRFNRLKHFQRNA